MNNITPVVKNLLIINIILYVATFLFKAQGIDLTEILGAHYFASPKFQVWQPLTYMFMHSDEYFTHILFNMFGLYMFGSILEAHWGAKRFLNFYLITGLGAIFLQWAVQAVELYQVTGSITIDVNNVANFSRDDLRKIGSVYFGTMVGASGALFGIMTAFAMLYPNIEMMLMFIPFPLKAKIFIPIYILVELFSGLARIEGDTIAHFAHLGGALIGFILVKLWRRKGNYYDYYD